MAGPPPPQVFRHLNTSINDGDPFPQLTPNDYPSRPRIPNTTGKEVAMNINSYGVASYPTQTIYQYDVLIGSGVEKRVVIQKVWGSKQMKKVLNHPSWIFDGNRLAWSVKKFDRNEVRLTVDLDEEQGRRRDPRPDHPDDAERNKFTVQIKATKTVNLHSLNQYLNGSGPINMDSSVIESISFFDHLLRVGPSARLTAIKRSFYSRGLEKRGLGAGIEAFKGIYQSLRGAQGGQLVVNVDVSNTAMWEEGPLTSLAINNCDVNDPRILSVKLYPPHQDPNQEAAIWTSLRRMKKISVSCKYRGQAESARDSVFVIKSFSKLTARQCRFDWHNPVTNIKKSVTIYEYFREKYNLQLQYPDLPLVEMTKKGVMFPMEFLTVLPNQRYPYKLNEKQTSEMIKFAVTRPDRRAQEIAHSVSLLKWGEDELLKSYGLKIEDKMLTTKARILPNPILYFGAKKELDPRVSGRWTLVNTKFHTPNRVPLDSWGVGICAEGNKPCMPKELIQQFIEKFIQQYTNHGGRVVNRKPHIATLPVDAAKAVEHLWFETGNKFNLRPKLLVFILVNRDGFHYQRIKKSCDCRYGVVSQCMQSANVRKGSLQYISNVLMKVNAKLRGFTNTAKAKNTYKCFPGSTMIIGADVSHASPGSSQASTAAMTVSMDPAFVRYAARCQTNGQRVEMIAPANIEYCLEPLVQEWLMNVNGGRNPQFVYYFRDGVSEGQFSQVLNEEVRSIKNLLRKRDPHNQPKFVVIICSKRHHIRFFPKSRSDGDKNGNPVPGTLVQHSVTCPNEYDFYLNSHSAIQGTARPVHYHVILDETKMSNNFLENMIYEHCYQYIRSTTPVSLFPAVYYAHLASIRSGAHVNTPASSGPTSGPGFVAKPKPKSEDKKMPTEDLPLLPMDNKGNILTDMWFI
ncbi:MAG: hypothetical protein M1834_008721 [Cirrosporium novae-zelandiae]|nr:MAG: hypothetical protein M1834_008721 [Cirrosporium novae-zelandiae]